MKLWKYPNKERGSIIEYQLRNHGKLIGSLETPYSIVYTLERNAIPRYVVAKAPKVDLTMTDDQIKERLLRFLHEVNNIYRTCNLSLIQRFSHIEIACGLPFLISVKRDMNLRDAMERTPLPVTTALSNAIQVSHAIAYINEKGISAHQDLKPENIFLDDLARKFRFRENGPPYQYQAYVADLDMANAAIIFNKPQGSRPYMAPEQYKRAESTGPPIDLSKADVFAIGVNLFEMLTGGVHPIGARTTDVWPNGSDKWSHDDIWKRWARNAASRLEQNSNSFDADLTTVMIGCLQVEPGNRPDATQLERALSASFKARDDEAQRSLCAYLTQVDEAEAVNSDAGWPYMDVVYARISNELA